LCASVRACVPESVLGYNKFFLRYYLKHLYFCLMG